MLIDHSSVPVKIIADNRIPFLRGALEPYAEVVYLPGNEITSSMVRDADALVIRTRTICNESLLKNSDVRFIATATIGYDHIDTEWCRNNGIAWTNCPGCNSASVMQYMASLLVTMSREFGFNLRDKTLGVVGVGNVGSKVAEIASLLGMKVLLCDPPRAQKETSGAFVSLQEIVSRSDIITCHVPLSREGQFSTYHMFDSEKLSCLSSNQILINTSRGEVIDNKALKNLLKGNGIMAASLDVFEGEPQVDPDLVKMLFTATPHIAGYSLDGKAAGTAMSVQAIGKFFSLPCRNWTISDIPQPTQPTEYHIDCTDKDKYRILEEAILYTYHVREDDKRLKASINTFEHQRSEYPVRREFPAFTVILSDSGTGNPGYQELLQTAGFSTRTTKQQEI